MECVAHYNYHEKDYHELKPLSMNQYERLLKAKRISMEFSTENQHLDQCHTIPIINSIGFLYYRSPDILCYARYLFSFVFRISYRSNRYMLFFLLLQLNSSCFPSRPGGLDPSHESNYNYCITSSFFKAYTISFIIT